jgi:hypothetical protein
VVALICVVTPSTFPPFPRLGVALVPFPPGALPPPPRGRPFYQADAAKLLVVAYVFIFFLLLLVSSSVYLDITHPVANPFG